MNFTNLFYFKTVAECLNFTQAAKSLYISQQSLSAHIARLEGECGILLFERTPKLKLTYAGEVVLEYARTILSAEKQMKDQLADITHDRSGKLSLGVYLHRSQLFLSQTLPEFIRLYPSAKIDLKTSLSNELEESLNQGQLDLIVGFTPFENINIETNHLVTERLCVAIPANMFESHFINSKSVAASFRKNGVDLSSISTLPFVFLEKENRARALGERLFKKIGTSPNILLQTADAQTMLALCETGIGCSFVFEQAMRDFLARSRDPSRLLFFPISDPEAEAHLVIAWNKRRYLNNTAKNFIRIAKSTFSQAGDSIDDCSI